MAGDFDQLRHSMPDLARVDPLSREVRAWLDQAHEAVKHVDRAEAVIFRMHERYLLDPAEKIVAIAEIAETLNRAARTRAIMRKTGVAA
jgi:hypothetical protein